MRGFTFYVPIIHETGIKIPFWTKTGEEKNTKREAINW
jgi:hypothetical protein